MNPFNFLAATARVLGAVLSKVDHALEGLAASFAAGTALLGSLVRLLHTGRIQQQLLFALVGVAATAAWLAAS
ncbi:MAG TPA: hypothetical protein VM509_05745 [Planctomycetota bacterium]|nr:hypothetical protein [Planctomycetota bacterium]